MFVPFLGLGSQKNKYTHFVIASEAWQSMLPWCATMDRRASLSMNRFVFANEVKQSMTSECMDCRATLAVTKSLFKVRVRYRAGFGRLAMTEKRYFGNFYFR